MDHEFWRSRWQQGRIGFHLGTVNPRLLAHQDALPAPGARVLAPLCGKSLDLWWLAGEGYDVVGVELSELAVQALFRERGLTPDVAAEGAFAVYRAPGMTIFCGDIFALAPAQLGSIEGVYDRAALIALPGALRLRYAAHLKTLVAEQARGLLICCDYAQTEMAGPPFAVSDAEVHALFGSAASLLASYAVLDEEPRFRAAGLTSLDERVYALRF